MKTIITTAILAALGLTTSITEAREFSDVATVISSTPIYQRIEVPRRVCSTEQVTRYDERRVYRADYDDRRVEPRNGIGPGTVLGAVVGGVIGHQFGNSSGGRDRATAVGAVVGGLIGNDIERNGDYDRGRHHSRNRVDVERYPVTREVERCRTVAEYRDEVSGYDVRYRYQGREYTTRLAYDPGSTLPVDIEVRPAHQQPVPRYRH
ncbi:MAG: glycine zipper 2TM domain-containing protein [Betaproteobacteria bacterium]|nr:glycine zipper 2TM domain-containing protein [Betaproteobacteria bacterium]